MAFCDNPKCKWSNCSGELSAVYYVENGTKFMVKNNDFADMSTGKEIRRNFCDDCLMLAMRARRRLSEISASYPLVYQDYLNDHGDNLLLHFIQME